MTRQSRFLCAAVVACCTWCGVDLEAAIGSDSRDWKQLRADGFTVIGSASESELRKVRDEIQLFRVKTYLEYGLAVGELKRLARTQPIGKRTPSVP